MAREKDGATSNKVTKISIINKNTVKVTVQTPDGKSFNCQVSRHPTLSNNSCGK